MVHVGAVDAPVSVGDVTQIAAEFKRAIGTGKDAPKTNGVDVLGWDFAFELNEVAKQQAAAANIQMRFLRIPRDVMDKRAVEQGDIHFFELAALSVDVKTKKRRRDAQAQRFRHSARRRAGRRAQGGQALVAVDRLLGGGLGQQGRHVPQRMADLSHAQGQHARSWRPRTPTPKPGEYTIVVKVIDILGNDTTKTVKVKVSVAMARKRKQNDADQLGLLEARVATAPCVPGIREKVKAWREGGYKGVTDTTRILLNYWFHTDHRLPNGRKFAYHYFQREAVETLIYLYEVAKVRRHKSLVETFATRSDLRLLQYDDFARYCVKMATGSGKTKVMSLAIAWQFFNAVAEARDDFAKTFLAHCAERDRVRAVADGFRGRSDLPRRSGHPARTGNLLADFQCYMRGEGERASSLGALYLTNMQQFYERQNNGERRAGRNDGRARAKAAGANVRRSRISTSASSIAAGRWSCSTTRRTTPTTRKANGTRSSAACTRTLPGGLAAQFDFTATPRHSKGQLFSWTVFDYPLKQAIIDNVVKRPLKGIAQGITEQRSDVASTRYQAYLAAGVERWKEYREQLSRSARSRSCS